MVREPLLSIVIPVRNDARALERTLDHLNGLERGDDVEVVVAASGDPEATRRVSDGRAALLFPDGSTRARLMNAGAAAARGRVLLFLHADSLPPTDVVRLVERALADPRVVGGAFDFRFAEPVPSLRAIAWINRMRYALTRNFYGDQGLFARASTFRRIGGFADVAFMEDFGFGRRLERLGRRVLVRVPLLTSGRRFLLRGPWRTVLQVGALLALATLGFDVQRYAEWWRGPADASPGSPWTRRTRGRAAGRRASRGRRFVPVPAARRPSA